jgi:hypothetical protein
MYADRQERIYFLDCPIIVLPMKAGLVCSTRSFANVAAAESGLYLAAAALSLAPSGGTRAVRPLGGEAVAPAGGGPARTSVGTAAAPEAHSIRVWVTFYQSYQSLCATPKALGQVRLLSNSMMNLVNL